MTAYSSDLRERVLADRDAGMATGDVANKYRVSLFSVRRLNQRRRETGSSTARAQRHGAGPTWAEHADRIAAAFQQRPDGTLEEHRQRLRLGLSASTLWRASRRWVDGKKNFEGRRAGPPRSRPGWAAVARRDTRVGPRPLGLRGRDLGEHEHDQSSRPQPRRGAAGDADATRPPEDDHVRRRAEGHRPGGASGGGWGDQGRAARGPTSTSNRPRPCGPATGW